MVTDKRPVYEGEQRKITAKYYVIGNELNEINAEHVKIGDKFYDKVKIVFFPTTIIYTFPLQTAN